MRKRRFELSLFLTCSLLACGGRVDLLFLVPTEWQRNGAPLRGGARDLPAFLEAHPEYGDLCLASLAVSMGRRPRERFYQGALSLGGRLTGPLGEVLAAYGAPPGGPGLFFACMSPSNSDERALYPDLGLQVLYRSPPPERSSDGTEVPQPPPSSRSRSSCRADPEGPEPGGHQRARGG